MIRTKAHTAQAAAMGVSAELARRGYDVAFTLGNTPKVDLLCNLPNDDMFKVQVKGLSNANGLLVRKSFFNQSQDHNLFLVVVLVPQTPKDDKKPFRYFVLSHDQARAEFEKMPKFTAAEIAIGEHDTGLNWGSITLHEDCWQAFPTTSGLTITPSE